MAINGSEVFEKQAEIDRVLAYKVKNNYSNYVHAVHADTNSIVENHRDTYPFFDFRMKLWRFYGEISNFSVLIAESKVFQSVVVSAIVMNIIYLIVVDPSNEGYSGLPGLFSLWFFIVYVSEMIIKILAYGFLIRKGAYLKDPWNVVDFCVIIAWVASYIASTVSNGSGVNLSVFRALRVFKPLKTLTAFQKLKAIVNTILNSVVSLLEVILILFITLLIYAIIGLQLFSGAFQYQCIESEIGSHKTWNAEEACGGIHKCHAAGAVCAKIGVNPLSGLYSFDKISDSYLMVYIIVAKEGWSTAAEYLIYTFGWPVIIFFIVIIITETWFLINLCLAIIAARFKEAQEEDEEDHEESELKNKEIGGKSYSHRRQGAVEEIPFRGGRVF